MSEPPARPDADAWRPRLHYTAPRGWLNDPNGLFRANGAWHLQYQYEWPRQWGHAVSPDLYQWETGPVALQPDAHGDCWSGCTVADAANTSGFFPPGSGGLVTIYTSQDEASGQRISLAWSADGGRTWEKFAGNPILRRAGRACRDPKVFWHEPARHWVMILTQDTPLVLYTSANLREWRECSQFTPLPGPGIDGFECPDLFPLPVENRPGATKWVLAASYLSGDNFKPNGFGICAQRYHVGSFDGEKFGAEPGGEGGRALGEGPDEYAMIVWPAETDGARRTIGIGWLNHWGYAKQIPTGGWQGCLTLPRELTLRETGPGAWTLHQAPARELWARPQRRREWNGRRRTAADGALVLGNFSVGAIRAALAPGPGAVVHFAVFAAGETETIVGYEADQRRLFLDRRRSGSPDFSPHFPRRKDVVLADGVDVKLDLLIVFDRSTVEVFAQDGAVYLSALTFPPPGASELRLVVPAGAITCERLEAIEFTANPGASSGAPQSSGIDSRRDEGVAAPVISLAAFGGDTVPWDCPSA